MCWSVSAKGTKEDVKATLTKQFEGAVASYAGTSEADDIAAVRDRTLAAVDAIALGTEYGKTYDGVEVSASGGHWTADGKVQHVDFSTKIERVALPTAT